MSKDQSAPPALELVRDFVNSVDLERPESDAFASADRASAWLAAHGFAGEATGDEAAAALRTLREAVRAVLLAHTGEGAVREAERVLGGLLDGATVRVAWCEGTYEWEPAAAPAADRLRADLAARIAEAHGNGTWARLKACRKHSCLFAFYDRSKNGSGAWCDMAVCGNRTKAAKRRAKIRPAAG